MLVTERQINKPFDDQSVAQILTHINTNNRFERLITARLSLTSLFFATAFQIAREVGLACVKIVFSAIQLTLHSVGIKTAARVTFDEASKHARKATRHFQTLVFVFPELFLDPSRIEQWKAKDAPSGVVNWGQIARMAGLVALIPVAGYASPRIALWGLQACRLASQLFPLLNPNPSDISPLFNATNHSAILSNETDVVPPGDLLEMITRPLPLIVSSVVAIQLFILCAQPISTRWRARK